MLETLGINPLLLIAQAISFGIVFYILSRFLFPQVRTALNDRREAVSKTYAAQAAIETRLKEFDQEQKASHQKVQEDVQRMIAEAKDAAAITKKDLVAKAQEAAAAELAAAQKRIEQERISAEAEVTAHAKTIAQSIVEQILTDKAADPAWQRAQIEASINAVKQNP